ncbi:MAG TPA: hypothetical protein VFC00_31585 [Micromonosporaceae bacterium]|nr:hypothetical protein [Micromonosporaceae bacterium]
MAGDVRLGSHAVQLVEAAESFLGAVRDATHAFEAVMALRDAVLDADELALRPTSPVSDDRRATEAARAAWDALETCYVAWTKDRSFRSRDAAIPTGRDRRLEWKYWRARANEGSP